MATTKYTKGDVVVVDKKEELVLHRISDILVTPDDNLLFITQILITQYNTHYHAYEILGTSDTKVIPVGTLYYHHPYHTHTCFSPSHASTQFVCPKHFIS